MGLSLLLLCQVHELSCNSSLLCRWLLFTLPEEVSVEDSYENIEPIFIHRNALMAHQKTRESNPLMDYPCVWSNGHMKHVSA